MSGGRSPNFLPSPRFSNCSPRNQSFNIRQPLYLNPNSSSYMSPRGNRMFSPGSKTSSESPDFLPLGISSPIHKPRQSWGRGNYNNNSSYSNSSSPPSFSSSHGFSPYRKRGSRGNFRGRGGLNNSGSNSTPIHLYYDRDALKDPWAALEEKLKNKQGQEKHSSEDTNKVIIESSGSEVSDEDVDGDDDGS